MSSSQPSASITVVVSDPLFSDAGDESDNAHPDPEQPFNHDLKLVEPKPELLSPLSPLSRSRLQKTLFKTSSDQPVLGKPRMSTSEIIQVANAPITEAAAKDLMDRGLYAQSSARFSQLDDATPGDARIRRLSNITAYLSNDYWGPVVPRMWSRFLRLGANEEIPSLVAKEFAEAVAEDAEYLFQVGRYHASLMALDVVACVVDHDPLPVLEGQKLADFNLCKGFQFDEKFGARVQDLFQRLEKMKSGGSNSRIEKLRQRFVLLEKSVCRGLEQSEGVKPLVLHLIDIGRLFDQGNTESHDLAMFCFDAAATAAATDLDRAYIERAIGRYKVDFAKTKGDLMENQRQVMQKFMSGVKSLRQGNFTGALGELSQALRLFPDNAACFAKTLEARVAVDISAAIEAIQRISTLLGDGSELDAQWCLKVASELTEANIPGLGPSVLKELTWTRHQSLSKQTGSIHDRLVEYDLRVQADAEFASGNFPEAATLYAKIGPSAQQNLADVQSINMAITLSQKAATRTEAIALIRDVQTRYPNLTKLQELIDEQTRRYLAGAIYPLWRKQALDELRSASHGPIGLVLLQQHALKYAEQSGLPDLVSDANKLIYAATLRAHAEQILNDESASEQSVKDAKAMWLESKEAIGGDGEVPSSASRRLAGMSSVQEALDTIQALLDHGRLQRAQRLLTSIATVDPGHPDIRRYQQALESARKNRDKARAEYVAAYEAELDKNWEQVIMRLKTANQHRPCEFYQKKLEHAESMLKWQSSSTEIEKQAAESISQKRWKEAKELVDRLAQIKIDEIVLNRLRAFVEVGLEDEQLRQLANNQIEQLQPKVGAQPTEVCVHDFPPSTTSSDSLQSSSS